MKLLSILLALALGVFGCWYFLSPPSAPEALQLSTGAQEGRADSVAGGSISSDEAGMTTRRESLGGPADVPIESGIVPIAAPSAVRLVGRVTTAAGLGLSGVRLSLLGNPSETGCFTGQEGSLVWPAAKRASEEEAFEIRFELSGYVPVLLRHLDTGESEQTLETVALTEGSSLNGRVVDSSGAPAVDVLVRATSYAGSYFPGRSVGLDIRGPFKTSFSSRGNPGELLVEPVRTDADGRFVVEDIPGSWAGVWAQSEVGLWAWSDLIALNSEEAREPVLLTLPPDQLGNWISGRLLDPDGDPVPETTVLLKFPSGALGAHGVTDAEGHFRVLARESEACNLTAKPPVWDWAGCELQSVLPGTTGVVMQFTAADWLWARVLDQQGEPITSGSAACVSPKANEPIEEHRPKHLGRAVSSLWDDGRARMHRPEETFDLWVSAKGYESKRIGPFAAGTSDMIEVRLNRGLESETIPQIRVRVSDRKGVVKDATVRLGECAANGREFISADTSSGDFRFAHEGTAIAQDLRPVGHRPPKTDSEGYVSLDLPEKGGSDGWQVIAGSEALGLAYSRVVNASDFGKELTLDLTLLRLGTLSGVLELAAPQEPQGWSVISADGRGGFAEAPVNKLGRYKFESLAPGPWQVRAKAPGLRAWGASGERDREPRVIDVHIRSGEEAHFDLEVEARPAAQLHGRIQLVGHKLGRWSASLQAKGNQRGNRWSSEVDYQGYFEFDSLEPGDFKLYLTSRDPRFQGTTLGAHLKLLPGENHWEPVVEIGVLQGRCLLPSVVPIGKMLFLEALDPESNVSTRLSVDDQGGIAPQLFPVGTYWVGLLPSSMADLPRYEGMPTMELTILPGEAFELYWDAR